MNTAIDGTGPFPASKRFKTHFTFLIKIEVNILPLDVIKTFVAELFNLSFIS